MHGGMGARHGPLTGLRVIEIAADGPVAFAAMMLADMGAEIIRVVPGPARETVAVQHDFLLRGRTSITVDLTHPEGTELLLCLAERGNVLLEGFRPGHLEGLGLGPADCAARNPGLVYGRMTGWGQTGPSVHEAGHDINFISVSGALRSFALPGEAPVPPLNLLGDFGGGAMMLVFGVLCAVFEASVSGHGQVVDAAMLDGTALLMTMVCSMMANGQWSAEPGTNLFDGAAPFYTVYETADHEYVSVGAVEQHCYRELLDRLGWNEADMPDRADRANWPSLKRKFADHFGSQTREHWMQVFHGSDACVTPVLHLTEAAQHPHNLAREVFVPAGGALRPAPAPRFSRTPGSLDQPASDLVTTLVRWEIEEDLVRWLLKEGIVAGG